MSLPLLRRRVATGVSKSNLPVRHAANCLLQLADVSNTDRHILTNLLLDLAIQLTS